MSFLERYWPSLVAIPIVIGAAIWLYPSDKKELIVEELPSDMQQEGGELALELAGSEADSYGAEVDQENSEEGGEVLEPILPESRTELRKTLRFEHRPSEDPGETEYNENSPEVKRALSQVNIELFGTDWCGHCRKAREFMRANGISFTNHDVDANPMLKERARRLSGSGGVPVIVIDGAVMTGFSVPSFQSRLTHALKKRVGAK